MVTLSGPVTKTIPKETPKHAEELAESVGDLVHTLLRNIQPIVEAQGISKGQFWALHALSNLDRATVGAVARHLAVTAPSVCLTVDQLEDDGLVSRTRSATDHRTVELSLTPKGRKVEERIWRHIGRKVVEAADGMPPEDLATALRVLKELSRHLGELPEKADRGVRA